MLTRQKTLYQNIAIYASLLVLLLMHAFFWGKWLKDARVQLTKLDGDHKELAASVERLRNDINAYKEVVSRAQEDLDRRQKELDDLGPNILPTIKAKSETIRRILLLVESLGIRITKSDFPQAESSREGGGGYYTVNFTLELVGPYRAFKQLLAKIQQADMVIRIHTFDLKDPGTNNPAYDWRVVVQFQTYFGS